MKTILLCLVFTSTIVISTDAQPDTPPETWFDFWVGTWDLAWTDANGNPGMGVNTIERTLDGKVIQENFEALSGNYKGFTGKSWSVWDANRNGWYQTWVDNQGGYLDFHAEFDGGKRMFVRSFEGPGGSIIHQRMVFYDITEDSFTWDWQNSQDGENWNLNWRIRYTRR